MQGEGGSFVLDDKAASAGRKRCKLWPYAVKGGLAGAVMDAVEGTVSTAPVDAVHSGRGATPRPEQTIEFGERTTADQCESPLALSRKPRDQYRQLARNMDEFRTRGDLEQGAVDIEIASRPELVHVPCELPVLIARLSGQRQGALALISGRPLAELDRMFASWCGAAAGVH